jgi:hypothetical protein
MTLFLCGSDAVADKNNCGADEERNTKQPVNGGDNEISFLESHNGKPPCSVFEKILGVISTQRGFG